jgi:hypothetical protein
MGTHYHTTLSERRGARITESHILFLPVKKVVIHSKVALLAP